MTNESFCVTWKSKLWSEGSSAIITREMVVAMDSLGYCVRVINTSSVEGSTIQASDLGTTRLRALETDDARGSYAVVRCAAPSKDEGLVEGMWDLEAGARSVAFLTLPNGYLPAGARPETANAVLFQVWACSEFVRHSLLRSGFDAALVRRIPLGYRPDVFKPYGSRLRVATTKRFKFIHVSIPYVYYKGIDVLVRAYVGEFDESDDVALILQTRPGGGQDTGVVHRLVEAELHRVGRYPEVVLIDGPMSQPDLASLYRSSQCYVQTSRCEGFGLPVLEAMACGLPVVAVEYGGHLEMCNGDNSYLVGFNLHGPPAEAFEEGLGTISEWADADVAHLRFQLRTAFEDRILLREKGRLAARNAREGFTWEHSAATAAVALGI